MSPILVAIFSIFFMMLPDHALAQSGDLSRDLERAGSRPEGAPSIDQLITLRQIGFNEDQIRAELVPFRGRLRYSGGELGRLESAGFSQEFVEFARSLTSGETLTNADIAGFLDQGMSIDALLDEIGNRPESERSFDTSASAMLRLRDGRRVPVALTKAMMGEPLTTQDLTALTEDGTPDRELLKLIGILGHQVRISRATDALELVDAGVSTNVLKRIYGASASEFLKTEDMSLEPEKEEMEFENFTHVTKLFSFPYPRNWFFERDTSSGTTVYYASPFRPRPGEAARIKADSPGISLRYWRREETTTKANVKPERHLDQTLSLRFVHLLEDFKRLGEVQTLEIDGRDAAYRDYEAVVARENAPVLLRWYLIAADDYLIGIIAHAPAAKFEALKPTFDHIVQTTTVFGSPFRTRERAPELTSSEISARYREAVVKIRAGDSGKAFSSGGTGFFVRSDGYLLTNHHVIYNEEENRPYREIEVSWSEDLDREPRKAELIDYIPRNPSSAERRAWEDVSILSTGEDLALLKISGATELVSIPLTPLEEVAIGDPVVTMGFPISEVFDRRVSTTVSSGVVTRFLEYADSIDSIITDAKIAPGSSGGPAISLTTGGVIGLTTRAPDATISDAEDRNLRNILGYASIMPIDRAMEHFPQQTIVQPEQERDLDHADLLDLGWFAHEQRWYAGATEIALRATEQAPFSAPSYFLYATTLLRGERPIDEEETAKERRRKEGLVALERAIDLDGSFYEALYMKAEEEEEQEEYLEAVKAIDQAIDQKKTWLALVKRAQLYIRMDQHHEALRDLDEAKSLNRGLNPDPFLYTGEIKYALGEFDDGRTEYELASQIAEDRVEPRRGIANYYLHTERYLDALLRFDQILEDFPNDPESLAGMGWAYIGQDEYTKGLTSLGRAAERYAESGEQPPEALLLEAAQLAEEEGFDRQAEQLYAYHLNAYWDSPSSYDGHVFLAERSDFRDRRAIRRAHLKRALHFHGRQKEEPASNLVVDLAERLADVEAPLTINLQGATPEADADGADRLEAKLRGLQGTPFTVRDIRAMYDAGYHWFLVRRLIESDGVIISITGDELQDFYEEHYNEERGQELARVIYDFLQQAERRPYPYGRDDGKLVLFGTWLRQNDAGDTSHEIELKRNFEFQMTYTKDGEVVNRRRGNWQVVGNAGSHELLLSIGSGPRARSERLPVTLTGRANEERIRLTHKGATYVYARIAR